MIFDDSNNKPWKPIYIQIIRLWWSGSTKTEIQDQLGCSYTMIQKVLDSDMGKQILSQLETNTFDSIIESQTMIQAVAPELIREKIKLALYSGNEHIRSKNTTELIEIAGHVPTQRVVVTRTDPLLDEYLNKNELDIRRELREIKKKIAPSTSGEADTQTTGPDGKPLN